MQLRLLWFALFGFLVTGPIAQANGVAPVEGDYVSRPDAKVRVSFTLGEMAEAPAPFKLVLYGFPDYRNRHTVITEEIRFSIVSIDGHHFAGRALHDRVYYTIAAQWDHDDHVSGVLRITTRNPRRVYSYPLAAHLQRPGQ